MSLLREIQIALMEGGEIAPILLKLRFLASRLGSEFLEEWVKHESEGYPPEVKVPSYRKVGVSYVGTFSGPFGSGIKNAPIPSYLIDKFAGEQWTRFEIRHSAAAIDDLSASARKSGENLRISASNLILLLQGEIYPDLACNSVSGTISAAALTEIQNAVRTRVLELSIELERALPSAGEIQIGQLTNSQPEQAKTVDRVASSVIFGNVTNVTNTGSAVSIKINVSSGDVQSFIDALVEAGITKADAEEFGAIVASEPAGSPEEPFGSKAKEWITKNISKAAGGIWQTGISVFTKVATEAALKYYGLK